MINVNLPRAAVRLLIDRALLAQLNEMDEDRYEVFVEAIRFAEDAISTRIAAEGELPQFLVPFDTLELVIVFCRIRERFVIRAIVEFGDDPPPGVSSPFPRETPAEALLRAAGIETHLADEGAKFLNLGLAEDALAPLRWPTAVTAIRVDGDPAAFSVMLTLGRLGLSGPFVTLTAGDKATTARFCAPVNTPPVSEAPTPATTDGEGTPPVPSGAVAPGTSTDP